MPQSNYDHAELASRDSLAQTSKAKLAQLHAARTCRIFPVNKCASIKRPHNREVEQCCWLPPRQATPSAPFEGRQRTCSAQAVHHTNMLTTSSQNPVEVSRSNHVTRGVLVARCSGTSLRASQYYRPLHVLWKWQVRATS